MTLFFIMAMSHMAYQNADYLVRADSENISGLFHKES